MKRDKGSNNNNIKIFQGQNVDENINNDKFNKNVNRNNSNNLNKISDDGQENIEDDENNSNNVGRHINYFNNPNVNPNMNRRKDYYYQKYDNYKKEEPKKINDNYNQMKAKNEPPIKKKKSDEINLLNLLTIIFFKNQQQTEINTQKIDERYLDMIRNAYIKHIHEEKNIVYIYVNNFIVNNILKLFKKRDIQKEVLEVVKNKVSLILPCIGMDKDYYSAYYYPNMIRDYRRNRQSSVEAAIRFRKEFQVSEEDLNQEVLVDKLYENNNDINRVFGLIYGK